MGRCICSLADLAFFKFSLVGGCRLSLLGFTHRDFDIEHSPYSTQADYKYTKAYMSMNLSLLRFRCEQPSAADISMCSSHSPSPFSCASEFVHEALRWYSDNQVHLYITPMTPSSLAFSQV